MSDFEKLASLPGKLIIIGFGIIGQGVIPLILRHLEIKKENIIIIAADAGGKSIAEEFGIRFFERPLNKENYLTVLTPLITKGDFLLNVSVNVSSVDLIKLCYEKGALYLDTCIEPWEGGYTDKNLSSAERSNYALREAVLALKRSYKGGPTAVVAQGANPGLVSSFVKQGLLNIAIDTLGDIDKPHNRGGWARLAQQLGIKVIHIAERDTQKANICKEVGEFVNTWSVDGFTGEGMQPAELGWGTHEKHWPKDAQKHKDGCGAAIYLDRPGATVQVRSWAPKEGSYHGFLITHNEAISIADYFTVKEGDKVVYRPTVHYAYHPCDDAVISLHELAGKNWTLQERKRVLNKEIVEGVDELGVLLMGHSKGGYWYGSQLSVKECHRLVPHNNATSLQVTSAILAGMVWAIENQYEGIVESDEMDFERQLEICTPYLGKVIGQYTDWNPLRNRERLFPEDVDVQDPWQFKNFRVF